MLPIFYFPIAKTVGSCPLCVSSSYPAPFSPTLFPLDALSSSTCTQTHSQLSPPKLPILLTHSLPAKPNLQSVLPPSRLLLIFRPSLFLHFTPSPPALTALSIPSNCPGSGSSPIWLFLSLALNLLLPDSSCPVLPHPVSLLQAVVHLLLLLTPF